MGSRFVDAECLTKICPEYEIYLLIYLVYVKLDFIMNTMAQFFKTSDVLSKIYWYISFSKRL